MDHLQGAKITNIIPESYTLAEGALCVIEHGEMEFNNIIKGIGLSELAYTEATGEVVENKSAIKKVIDSVIEWLKKKWESVKELFNKALETIASKIDAFKSKMDSKIFEKVKAKAAKIKEKDKDGNNKIYGKTYEFTKLDELVEMKGPIWDAVNKFNSNAHGIVTSNTAKTQASSAKNLADGYKDTMLTDIAKACGVPKNEITADADLMAAVNKYIRGNEVDVDKKYINDHISEMFDLVTDKNKAVKKIKKTYNEVKKSYNSDISALKKEKKEIGADIYMACVKAVKESKMVSTAIIGAVLSNVKSKVSNDMKIIMKLSVTGNEKPVGEAVVESTSYQTELVSLFSF